MASNQVRREKDSDERQVPVEKDRVPKMASHFESLTVSPSKDSAEVRGVTSPGSGGGDQGRPHGGQFQSASADKFGGVELGEDSEGEKRRQEESEKSSMAGKFEMQGGEEKDMGRDQRTFEMQGGNDIGQYRQTAQQNSMDAISTAEERYNKAKVSTAAALKSAIDTTRQKLGDVSATQKGAHAKDTLLRGTQQAKDTLVQSTQGASQYSSEKGGALKDTTLEKGQQGYETTKSTLASAGKTAADLAVPAEDYVVEKTAVAKDVAAEKAAVAKDVAVESGKGTAGYVGKVAADVRDKAVVAGWGAAEFSAEKVVGATKAVASVTAGAAEYAEEKAVAAKDVVASAGVSAKDYAGQKLAAAKDAVVATEESAKEYAARKRAEADRELQAKKQAESKGEMWSRTESTEGTHHDIAGAAGQTLEAAKETVSEPVQKVGEFFEDQPENEAEGHYEGQQQTREVQQGGSGGGVLHAIGETIAEIGQTTKDLLVGQGPAGPGPEGQTRTKGSPTENRK